MQTRHVDITGPVVDLSNEVELLLSTFRFNLDDNGFMSVNICSTSLLKQTYFGLIRKLAKFN